MKSFLAFLLLLAPALLGAEDLRPDTSGVPLFQVFRLVSVAPIGASPDASSSNHLTMESGHPLLSVTSVSDFMLKSDKRRVRVVLTMEDSLILSKIFRTFDAIGIIAGDNQAIVKSKTKFDGSLTFDDPVAGYLRRRFHVTPGTNEVVPPPAHPFAPPS